MKKMRALLLRKRKKEVDRREGREEEGICRPMSKCFLRPCNTRICKYNLVTAKDP